VVWRRAPGHEFRVSPDSDTLVYKRAVAGGALMRPVDTYTYIFDALVEKDSLPPGHSPLRASDSLATPEADESTT